MTAHETRRALAMCAAFLVAVGKLVHDLRTGSLRAGLCRKSVSGHPGVYEITRADNGRATFSFGEFIRPGHVHITWRRTGRHAMFDDP